MLSSPDKETVIAVARNLADETGRAHHVVRYYRYFYVTVFDPDSPESRELNFDYVWSSDR